MNDNVTVTLKMLGWAAISGALDALAMNIFAPEVSLETLGKIAVVGALKGAALVWKQRPGN